MRVPVCVCVCVRACVRVRVCARVRACVHACVCVCTRAPTRTCVNLTRFRVARIPRHFRGRPVVIPTGGRSDSPGGLAYVTWVNSPFFGVVVVARWPTHALGCASHLLTYQHSRGITNVQRSVLASPVVDSPCYVGGGCASRSPFAVASRVSRLTHLEHPASLSCVGGAMSKNPVVSCDPLSSCRVGGCPLSTLQ